MRSIVRSVGRFLHILYLILSKTAFLKVFFAKIGKIKLHFLKKSKKVPFLEKYLPKPIDKNKKGVYN